MTQVEEVAAEMPDLQEDFHITFGRRYADEPHPTCPIVHPDGWITLRATNYYAARALAYKAFGQNWCDVYTSKGFEGYKHLYPLGELGTVAVEVTVVPTEA